MHSLACDLEVFLHNIRDVFEKHESSKTKGLLFEAVYNMCLYKSIGPRGSILETGLTAGTTPVSDATFGCNLCIFGFGKGLGWSFSFPTVMSSDWEFPRFASFLFDACLRPIVAKFLCLAESYSLPAASMSVGKPVLSVTSV